MLLSYRSLDHQISFLWDSHRFFEEVDLNEAHRCGLNLVVVNHQRGELVVGSKSIGTLSGLLHEFVGKDLHNFSPTV
jgi:hypothetical protein